MFLRQHPERVDDFVGATSRIRRSDVCGCGDAIVVAVKPRCFYVDIQTAPTTSDVIDPASEVIDTLRMST